MKTLSENQAVQKLRNLKDDFREAVRENYEYRAKNCLTCETQGACCLDEHFVNVHITKLEAVLIDETLQKLSTAKLKEVSERVENTVDRYELRSEGDTFAQTFACPLFEKGTGCLVHEVKPAPCIQHACYEKPEDLPPDELQAEIEAKIERLNEQTYRRPARWMPLPIWLQQIHKVTGNK